MRDGNSDDWPNTVPSWGFNGIEPPVKRTLWHTFRQTWAELGLMAIAGAGVAVSVESLFDRLEPITVTSIIGLLTVVGLWLVALPFYGALKLHQAALNGAEQDVKYSLTKLGLWPDPSMLATRVRLMRGWSKIANSHDSSDALALVEQWPPEVPLIAFWPNLEREQTLGVDLPLAQTLGPNQPSRQCRWRASWGQGAEEWFPVDRS